MHPTLRLLDVAETPRAEGWSLRSALVRYAQPEPERAGRLLQSVRRLEAAFAPSKSAIERQPDAPPAGVMGLFPVARLIDAFADEMVAWATHRQGERPVESLDRACDRIEAELDRLGVPRETIDPSRWRGMRASEGRRRPARGSS